MMNINTQKASPGKNRLVKQLRSAMGDSVDEDKFKRMQTNRSLPFTPGVAIAVKVVDRVGTEHMRVIYSSEYEAMTVQ